MKAVCKRCHSNNIEVKVSTTLRLNLFNFNSKDKEVNTYIDDEEVSSYKKRDWVIEHIFCCDCGYQKNNIDDITEFVIGIED